MTASGDPIDLTENLKETPPDVVLAHLMLGTVTSAMAAIDLVTSSEVDPAEQRALLNLASRRLGYVAAQLRCLSAGLPREALDLFVAEYRVDSHDT